MTAVIPLDRIDLAKIGHITPAGRVQDKEYNHDLPVVDALLAHGQAAIPYLIDKLSDGTEINDKVMDYWYEIHIGDVAFIILTNFFQEPKRNEGTIPGVGWDELLERGRNKDISAYELYYNYLAKHGRKGLKARWQRIWASYQDRVYWDDADRCFRVKPD